MAAGAVRKVRVRAERVVCSRRLMQSGGDEPACWTCTPVPLFLCLSRIQSFFPGLVLFVFGNCCVKTESSPGQRGVRHKRVKGGGERWGRRGQRTDPGIASRAFDFRV